jgi:hypothetical protein
MSVRRRANKLVHSQLDASTCRMPNATRSKCSGLGARAARALAKSSVCTGTASTGIGGSTSATRPKRGRSRASTQAGARSSPRRHAGHRPHELAERAAAAARGLLDYLAVIRGTLLGLFQSAAPHHWRASQDWQWRHDHHEQHADPQQPSLRAASNCDPVGAWSVSRGPRCCHRCASFHRTRSRYSVPRKLRSPLVMNQVLSIPPAASATTLQGALIGDSEEDGVGWSTQSHARLSNLMRNRCWVHSPNKVNRRRRAARLTPRSLRAHECADRESDECRARVTQASTVLMSKQSP